VALDVLPHRLAPTWFTYFASIDTDLALTGSEWWAAVTWQTADKARYGWMRVERTTPPIELKRWVIHRANGDRQPAELSGHPVWTDTLAPPPP
jgi:hypothetical protein